MKLIDGIVGESHAWVQEPARASQDFASTPQAKAGAYCFIGNGDGAHRDGGHGEGPCRLYNPSYDFNDELIPLGATYWVRLAEAWLGAPLP
jgi:hippurate hydrolase